jgi:hypothetical protein
MGKTKTKPRRIIISGPGGILSEIGDPWADTHGARKEMEDVWRLALSHLLYLGQEVTRACKTFESFTLTKIENMSTSDLSRDMVTTAFKFGLDVIEEMIPFGKGLQGVGKVIYSTMKSTLRSSLESPVKGLKGDIDEKKLKKIMRDLSVSAQTLATSWKTSSPGGSRGTHSTGVLQALHNQVVKLQRNLQAGSAGKSQITKEQRLLLERFYNSDLGEKQAFLQHFYGIPRLASSKRAARKLYFTLADKFSIPYGYAAGTMQEQSFYRTGSPLFRAGNSASLPQAARYRREAYTYWRKRGNN